MRGKLWPHRFWRSWKVAEKRRDDIFVGKSYAKIKLYKKRFWKGKQGRGTHFPIKVAAGKSWERIHEQSRSPTWPRLPIESTTTHLTKTSYSNSKCFNDYGVDPMCLGPSSCLKTAHWMSASTAAAMVATAAASGGDLAYRRRPPLSVGFPRRPEEWKPPLTEAAELPWRDWGKVWRERCPNGGKKWDGFVCMAGRCRRRIKGKCKSKMQSSRQPAKQATQQTRRGHFSFSAEALLNILSSILPFFLAFSPFNLCSQRVTFKAT